MARHTAKRNTDTDNTTRHEYERNYDHKLFDRQTQEKTPKEYFWSDFYECNPTMTNFMQKSGRQIFILHYQLCQNSKKIFIVSVVFNFSKYF